MRETSNSLSTQHSQQPKQFRGGEKKVMKKSLSLLVAITMVFSMFASVAFAADKAEPTQQEKFDALKGLGIFTGFPDGSAGLDKNMTRAQFAKVLTVGTGLEENAAASTYSDVSASHWAKGFIGAVTEAGLMQGKGNNKFDPNGNVTIQELAKTMVLSLGLEPVEGATVEGASAWAAGYVQAALDAMIIPSLTNYNVPATRGQLVDSIYAAVAGMEVTVKSAVVVDAKTVKVTFSDDEVVTKTLDTALEIGKATKVSVEYKGTTYEVEVTYEGVKVDSIAQTGAKKLTVTFKSAVAAADQAGLTYEVKNGLVPYNVTAKFAEDGKSVVLEAAYLPAGTYNVTVKGNDAVEVKVVDQLVSKVEITAAALQQAAGQDLGVKAFNQFNEDITSTTALTVNAYHNGVALNIVGGKVDLSTVTNGANVYKIDDAVTVTAFYSANGLSASKTFKIVAKSSATSVQLGQVAPLKDKTRISVNESGLVLPYTFVDQYGNKIVLPQGDVTVTNGKFTLAGVDFYINNPAGKNIIDTAVDSIKVDANGVLTFKTGADSGTVVVTAVNPLTGASSSSTIVVNPGPGVKSFQASVPANLIVSGEENTFPYVAVDTYDGQIAAKDIGNFKSQISFTSSNSAVAVNAAFNNKGELKITATLNTNADAASTIVFIWINNQTVAQQLNLEVKKAATPVAITGIKDTAMTLGIEGEVTINPANVTYVDNYGRTNTANNLPAGNELTITEVDANAAATSKTGSVIKGVEAGSEQYTLAITGVANSGKNVTFTTVANDKITSFSADAIGTIYGGTAFHSNKTIADYAKSVKITGKLADGTTVAIKQSKYYTAITSSDSTVASVNGEVVTGVAKGTVTIMVWNGATKVAEIPVTVSDVVPVATTAKFTDASVEINGANANADSVSVAGKLEVKDQYGVAITAPAGTYASSNTGVALVNGAGLVTEKANDVDGETTISFVTSNGIVATITVSIINN
jgi:hypothetical protein